MRHSGELVGPHEAKSGGLVKGHTILPPSRGLQHATFAGRNSDGRLLSLNHLPTLHDHRRSVARVVGHYSIMWP